MKTRSKKIASFRMMAGEELDLELVNKEHEARGEVEAFARRCYRRAYGSDINTFARELIVLKSADRRILSCVGVNPAGSGSFFLEQYLDSPIEQEISRIVGRPVDRSRVAEIGTLATGERGLCRLTMIGLAGMLKSRGIRYIAFTGTKGVRNTLESLGIPLHYLGRATPERLKGDAGEWGDYYSAEPEVVFLDVNIGCRRIERAAREINRIPVALALLMKAVLAKGVSLEEKKAA